VDRIGGAGVDVLIRRAVESGRSGDPTVRQELAAVYAEERVRNWTNQRVRAADLLGPAATAWVHDGGYPGRMPPEVKGMLRSRANTIEGGTSEVNRNILGERVLGLPREPDPWTDRPWEEVPRS